VDRAAVTRGSGRPRLFGVRAAVVLAVLAGLFGMHGLSVGHAPMTMDASVAAAHPMPGQVPVPVPVLPRPASTVGVALVSVLSGQSGAGSAGHTGMTSMTCVAVLAGAVVLALLVSRRVFARRRARPSWPAPAAVIARRVTPRVVVVARSLSLSQLCVMRV